MVLQNSYRKIWKIALLPIIDFLSLFVGIFIVFLVRYSWLEENFLTDRKISITEYLWLNLIISISIVCIYSIFGLYLINKTRSIWQSFVRLIFGIVLVFIIIITYLFFNEYNTIIFPNGMPVSRFILATGWFFALCFVIIGRLIFNLIENIFYLLGKGKINIIVVNANREFIKEFKTKIYINKIYSYKDYNLEIHQKILSNLRKKTISEIYIFGKHQNQSLISDLATVCEKMKINLFITPQSLMDFYVVKVKTLYINKEMLLEIQRSNLDGWNVVFKRIFDFIFALLFIVCFSWLYLIIAILIKLDSKGPIIYASQRVGPNGKTFMAYKFRRLKTEFCTDESDPKSLAIEAKLIKERDNRKDGILYKIIDDPRSTKIGKFLEKTSLDELPQFFNVLLGNMSIVGPRPHQPREVAKYKEHHFHVLNIKPGITGYAQINGRSDLKFEEEVKLDIFYLENWSFWLDLSIILKTPLIVIFKRHF